MSDQNNTIKLELSKGLYALVDADCQDWIIKQKWCATTFACADPSKRKYYAACNYKIDGKKRLLLLHRAIMNAQKGQIIDHINGDTLDNRRKNLRFCNTSQNGANAKPKRNKLYKGIYYRKNRNQWVARIVVNYKKIHLGHFDSAEEAAREYDRAAIYYFKEFAKLNFEESRD